MISFYLGGARSGKSGLAEQEVSQMQLPTTYIATANASDSMSSRIALHQQQRPASWVTREVPLTLTQSLLQLDKADSVIIVDCLTLWLTNHLVANNSLETEIDALCQTLASLNSHVVLVSTEVGHNLIPDDEMSYQFVIASGLMHQQIAAIAHKVNFCQAKLAISLKESTPDSPIETESLAIGGELN